MSNERQQRAARAEQMRKEREKADRRQRNVITIAIVVIVIALIALGGYAIKTTSDQNKKATDVVAPSGATEDYGIVYDAEAAGGSSADAKPVSVELYEDFQCPACLAFERANQSFLEEQVKAGAITITYRPFSFLDQNGGSPNRYSHRSTNIALCALDSGGVADYVKVHNMLYANQPEEGTNGPDDTALIKSVKDLGVTVVESCVRSEKFTPWIDEAREFGSSKGVSSTPTVKVAGEVVKSPSPSVLQQAIAEAQKGS